MPTRKPLPQLYSWLQNPLLSLHLQHRQNSFCQEHLSYQHDQTVQQYSWLQNLLLFLHLQHRKTSFCQEHLSYQHDQNPTQAYSQAVSSAEASSSADSFSCTTARTHPHRSIYNNLKKMSLTISKM
jgi:hypothetical protein